MGAEGGGKNKGGEEGTVTGTMARQGDCPQGPVHGPLKCTLDEGHLQFIGHRDVRSSGQTEQREWIVWGGVGNGNTKLEDVSLILCL